MAETGLESSLTTDLASKDAVIGIIGLGYVGLPLAQCFATAGYRVLGFDIDPEKAKALNAGRSYIKQIPDAEIALAQAQGFSATADYVRVGEAAALIICVPTPLDRHRQPDLSFIEQTVDALVPHLRKGCVVSLESTTYPGTTEEVVVPRLEAAGFKLGEDVFVVYSPERQDPGNTRFGTADIPKICSGVTPACQRVAQALYGQAIRTLVPVSSTRAAEMAKLLENIHRAVNVGLVNEMKMVADRMGLDIYEVIAAAATKPFGFVPYYPGPGLGGHCIPIDPFYLTWKAREYGIDTRFIQLAGEVNSAMPEWVVSKVVDALNAREKSVRGSRILMLGIAYKKNVDDTRESPAVEMLRQRGALIEYADPHLAVFPRMREHRFDLASQPTDAQSLEGFDCVVLATDHDAFDYAAILQHANLIVDARGRFPADSPKVVRA
jgi:UDP-N-acetyl-D-glucosamine dehydrogenase